MNHEKLFTLLSKYGTISETEKLNIKKYFIPIEIKKKQVLIEKHAPCNKLFFINKGLLRAFYTDSNGKETIRMIAWENRFLTNVTSFRNFEENNETIDCIEKAEILYIDRTDFDTLLKTSLNIKSIYADILEEYNSLHIKRFEQLNSENALEKLKFFNENFFPLKNRINNTQLSSFLSISRKTIERIRKINYPEASLEVLVNPIT